MFKMFSKTLLNLLQVSINLTAVVVVVFWTDSWLLINISSWRKERKNQRRKKDQIYFFFLPFDFDSKTKLLDTIKYDRVFYYIKGASFLRYLKFSFTWRNHTDVEGPFVWKLLNKLTARENIIRKKCLKSESSFLLLFLMICNLFL